MSLMSPILILPFLVAAPAKADLFPTVCEEPLITARSHQDTSEALNEIIRDQLVLLGIDLPVQTHSTIFSRWRARRLLAQADARLFHDGNLRNHWVERVVSLKIEENLTISGQMKNPLNEDQSRALTRVVLRSLLQRALKVSGNSSDYKTNWKAIVRRIHSNPVFRFIFLWQLPRHSITLTDDQLVHLLQNGARTSSDIELQLVNATNEQRELRKRKINSLMSAALGAFLTVYTGWAVYPDIQSAYEAGHAKAVQENTEAFRGEITGLSQLNSESFMLEMARSEIQILQTDFFEQFGESPSSAERLDLQSQICKIRYGDVLSQEGQSQCMKQQPSISAGVQ